MVLARRSLLGVAEAGVAVLIWPRFLLEKGQSLITPVVEALLQLLRIPLLENGTSLRQSLEIVLA
jgi:hypothetical protein